MTLEEAKTNITVRNLHYNSSFLFDTESFSFIIFKRLYRTSFKLNIVNFSIALPPGPPEPIEGFTVRPDPHLCFISQFMQIADFFSSWLTPCRNASHSTVTNLLVVP